MRAGAAARRGGLREILAFAQRESPDVLAAGDIDPGDALTIATRLAVEWAYRGGQAIFWNARFEPAEISEAYLPRSPAMLKRRGLLVVRGAVAGIELTIAATQLDESREQRIPQLRFVRERLRAGSPAIAFAPIGAGRVTLTDLGYARADSACTWIRGIPRENVRALEIPIRA